VQSNKRCGGQQTSADQAKPRHSDPPNLLLAGPSARQAGVRHMTTANGRRSWRAAKTPLMPANDPFSNSNR
jgi:hypothetical protein